MALTETPTAAPVPPVPSVAERTWIAMSATLQPHGYLLLCALPSWTVRAVSANAAQSLGREAAGLLDVSLDEILPERTLHDLRNVLQGAMVSGGAERLLDRPIDDGPARYDLTVHMTAGHAAVEIVPCAGAVALAGDPLTLVKSMLARLKRAPTIDRFLHLTASQIRAVTGFDRVMVYKFLPDGTGEVRAEALRSGLSPFLGRRYPASDIPAEARALYRKQGLRQVPDVNSEAVPLLARPDAVDVDLGLASLRGEAPVRIEDLRSMGAQATLTISLMAGDALWGLIACHHASPRRVSSSLCSAAELFGQIVSLQIEVKERAGDLALAADLRKAHDRLIGVLADDLSIFDAPDRFRDLVTATIPCDGYGVWSDTGFVGVGVTPPKEAVPDLLRHIGERVRQAPYASDALSQELPSAAAYGAEVSGVLSIPCPGGRRGSLLFFRRESIRTILWGRDPIEAIGAVQGVSGDPTRRSFEAWKETVRGRSSPWRRAELQIAETLRIALMDVILRRADRQAGEHRAAIERQGIVIAALNRRVRTTLGSIRALERFRRRGTRPS